MDDKLQRVFYLVFLAHLSQRFRGSLTDGKAPFTVVRGRPSTNTNDLSSETVSRFHI